MPLKCFPWFFFFEFEFQDVLGWRLEDCVAGWSDHAPPVYADKVPALVKGLFHGVSAFSVNEFFRIIVPLFLLWWLGQKCTDRCLTARFVQRCPRTDLVAPARGLVWLVGVHTVALPHLPEVFCFMEFTPHLKCEFLQKEGVATVQDYCNCYCECLCFTQWLESQESICFFPY